VVVALGALGASAGPALAHATLVGSTPALNGRGVSADAKAVTLRFSEAVQILNRSDVTVVTRDGRRWDTGAPRVAAGDPRQVIVPLRGPLLPRSYTVRYRVVSADSHTAAQAFVFAVGGARLGEPVRLLPMTDDRVQTRVEVDGPDGPQDLGFQQWWVGRGAADPVRSVRLAGIERARPAPGLLEAIGAADGVVLCPSNPVVSIAPILAVPGVREAVEAHPGRKVAVSPIVGGAPVRGMADRLLPAWGVEVSARGVAGLYAGLVDAFVLDQVDAGQAADVARLGLEPVVAPTLMHTVEDAAALAKVVLATLAA
jgi:methionine-rich copper-binding protein CopC